MNRLHLNRFNSGVTLIELVVVLMITAIMTSALITTASTAEGRRLNTAAVAIQSDLRTAQRSAVIEGRPYSVEFAADKYAVMYETVTGRVPAYTVVKTVEFRQGISITKPESFTIKYTVRGTVSGACTIRLDNDTHYISLTVNVANGRVNVGGLKKK